MNNNWTAKIVDNGFKLTREIWLSCITPQGYIVVQGNKTVTVKEGEALDTPSMELYPEQLQALADALGKAGIHPRKEYLEGKLEATESHLKDMRFLLKIKT